VKLPQPQFEGQTKGKSESDIAGTAGFVNESWAFLEQNTTVAANHEQQSMRCRAREAARKARDPTRCVVRSIAGGLPANLQTVLNVSLSAANCTSSRASRPVDRQSRDAIGASRRSCRSRERF
jgi:DNA gyrase/topoisomerase IV subunit B